MKPSSSTQRASSGTQLAGGVPGTCGSWHTPAKLSGYSVTARWIMSLQISDQYLLAGSLPSWCAMPAARGEKIVRSVPRSRCSLSCAPSRLSRISSSEMPRSAGIGA